MVRRRRAKAVDRALAIKYHAVGRGFLSAASDLSTVAVEDESYGNAIALLAIHGAIAMADAIAIAYGEQKSTDGDRGQAVSLLRDILRDRLPKRAESQLRALVGAKDSVSYQGTYYQLGQGRTLLKRAQQFAQWADQMYQERPPA